MPVDPGKREEYLEKLVKAHKGEEVVYRQYGPAVKIPFDSPMLTWATMGGCPIGHFCRWYGPEGCLDADTFLQYNLRTADGRVQNSKGGTIERLYERFNGIMVRNYPEGFCNNCGDPTQRKRVFCSRECSAARKVRKPSDGTKFTLPSINDEGYIVHNEVIGVVKTGTKECFEVETVTGRIIRATEDHKFYVGDGYLPLSEISEGSLVFIHDNIPDTGKQPRIHRKQTTVKHHPWGQHKEINGYDYKQLYVSRLVVEANMNGLSYEDYKDRLNAGFLAGLVFLSPDQHVHHVDEDVRNNQLSNLVVMWADEHNRHHAIGNNKLSFIAVEDEILSINSVGTKNTYDVQMANPFNNYVADGFVVHNSGKSMTNWGLVKVANEFPEYISEIAEIDIKWLESRGRSSALVTRKIKKRAKELIKKFPNGMEAIVFDTEQRVDYELLDRLGIDVKRLEVIDNVNIIEEVIRDASAALEAYHIVIIDSATNAQSFMEAALDPGEYEQGTGAKAWSRLKQFRQRFDRKENLLIIVDQVRSTGIGGSKRFRGPETAPPNVRFLRHNSSMSIEYDVGKKLYLDKYGVLTDDYDKASTDIKTLGTDGKEPHGLEMRCKVMKNSTGRPFRNARMRFRFPVNDIRTGEPMQDVGFDHAFEMLEIAEYFDILEKSGSYWYLLDDNFERIKKEVFHGDAKAHARIAGDEELQIRILGRLYADSR